MARPDSLLGGLFFGQNFMTANLVNKSYRPNQAAEFLGIGRATLWRWVKERHDFPRPIRLSARCTVIPGDKLIAWRDAQGVSV
jgi:prophage regulatory protein